MTPLRTISTESHDAGAGLFESCLHVAVAAVIVVSVLICSLQSHGYLLTNDLSSYLAPALAVVNGSGAPYVDYFDIKPPGMVMILVPWIVAFGSTLSSMAVLNAVALMAMWSAAYALAVRTAGAAIAAPAIAVACLLSIGQRQFIMLITTETFGLLAVYGALLLAERSASWRWVAAGALLALAGQIKEPYLLALPAAAWLAWRSPRPIIAIVAIASGYCLSIAIVAAFLIWTGALDAYLEAVSLKAQLFGFSPYHFAVTLWNLLVKLGPGSLALWFMLPVVLLVASSQTLRAGWHAAVAEIANFKSGGLITATLLAGGLIAGFTWQQKTAGDHYLITVWGPFFIAAAAWLSYLAGQLAGGRKVAQSIATLSLLFPSPVALSGTAAEIKTTLFSSDTANKAFADAYAVRYEAATAALHDGGCLQQAYGWDAGAAYVYTGASPCSRYFLPNLVVGTTFEADFRASLISAPPSVVIYEHERADLNIAAFERSVFDWQSVLDNCYEATASPVVFVARTRKPQLGECVATNSKAVEP